jgi:hypothetical protein
VLVQIDRPFVATKRVGMMMISFCWSDVARVPQPLQFSRLPSVSHITIPDHRGLL